MELVICWFVDFSITHISSGVSHYSPGSSNTFPSSMFDWRGSSRSKPAGSLTPTAVGRSSINLALKSVLHYASLPIQSLRRYKILSRVNHPLYSPTQTYQCTCQPKSRRQRMKVSDGFNIVKIRRGLLDLRPGNSWLSLKKRFYLGKEIGHVGCSGLPRLIPIDQIITVDQVIAHSGH